MGKNEIILCALLLIGAISSTGLIGGDANFNIIDIAVVPEPSTWANNAVGATFLGLLVLRRQRA